MAYTYSKIARYDIGSGGVPDVYFLNIPQNYTDLIIKVSMRAITGGGINSNVQFSFNNSTAAVSLVELAGTGTAASSSRLTQNRIGYFSGSGSTSNAFGSGEIYIPNYTGNSLKTSIGIGVSESNDAGTFISTLSNISNILDPIKIIRVFSANNLAQYSSISLYGIRSEV